VYDPDPDELRLGIEPANADHDIDAHPCQTIGEFIHAVPAAHGRRYLAVAVWQDTLPATGSDFVCRT
jgi:hypothetical protein